MSRPVFLPLLVLALAGAGCATSAPEEEETLVFAASSLAGVLPEIGEAFTERHGTLVRFSFGSSAALARQVAAGAPADLLVSADHAVHATLVGRMPHEGAYLSVASNGLVLVAARDAAWPAEGLERLERVAVGDWRAGVPVGLRAKEWLVARGEWEAVQDRLLPCADARATLAAVASGAAPAGIVYATDAASDERVRIVERPAAGGPRVEYNVYELGPDRRQAQPFALFLGGPEAAAVFERHGFRSAAQLGSGS